MAFIQYIKDTRAEMRHVAWPTQTQTIVYTTLVIIVSLLVAVYVGFFDFLLTRGLETVLTGSPVPQQQVPEGLETVTIPVDGTEGGLELNINPEAAANLNPLQVEAIPTEEAQQ